MDYGGKYLKIREAIHEAGFDDFYQAGSVSRFHKMNIVAESAALGLRFGFCISGGYNVADEYYIVTRKIGSKGPDEHVYCKNQQEMVVRIGAIRQQIEAAKSKAYETFKLQWMLDHGYTLKDLIRELDEMRAEYDSDLTLESIFADWEFGYGFGSEIWPCFEEYLECEGKENAARLLVAEKTETAKQGYSCSKEVEPLILEPGDWQPDEWATLCKLAGDLPPQDTERIVISGYTLETYIARKEAGTDGILHHNGTHSALCSPI